MSQKWIRSKRWDDEHFPPWAYPAKFTLRAFSSIWLAVILLVLVCIYGTMASVPIGLLAKIPTVMIYALTVVGAILAGAAAPTYAATRLLRSAGVGRAGRFAAAFFLFGGLTVASVYAWQRFAWPALRYDPRTGGGLMLFAPFVERYSSTTLRRLPGMEMSELEFYSWWPLRVILLAFVANMIVATLRRIEFTFHNIGVLTVHTGIVTIALGSVYYSAGKQEGDMILLAGPPDARGKITPGKEGTGFYDNTDVVLWVGQKRGMSSRGLDQLPIRGLPRYNDYGLNVLGVDEMAEAAAAFDEGRTLDIPVPLSGRETELGPVVDPDIELSVVGYASYAELESRWVASENIPTGDLPNPMRRVELLSALPAGESAPATAAAPGENESVIAAFRFLPEKPAERIRWLEDAVAIEYTRQMPEMRWRDLTTRLPEHVHHALVVEVPDPDGGPGFRQVFAAGKGARIEVGQTGYTLDVQELHPRPPFPIITPGYQGAESSVAVVRVTPPASATGQAAVPFTRYVYHRFPEINQDLLDTTNAQGMPARRDADPAIRIGYIDASMVQVHLDELPADADAPLSQDRAVRSVIRIPGRDPVVTERATRGETIAIAPMVGLRLGERWAHAASVEAPRVVPAAQREKDSIGTHRNAAVAVRVSREGDPTGWSETIWVPFSLYMDPEMAISRTLRMPDGRELTIAFGRLRHSLPGLRLQLVDFEMFPYPHSDVPQDYRSDLLVLIERDGEDQSEVRPTSLNAPLQIRLPFRERPDLGAGANLLGRLLSPLVPMQYKFSQAGWDAQGWQQSKALADQGQIERPFARFTILGVGNNPGIYIIAAGAIMMCCGIPWAFYVKPWLVKRKKRAIQAELAARAAAAKTGEPVNRPGAAPGADKRVEMPAGAER